MRIVFMGTPEFAVPSLQALIDNGYEVVGAFTQPDRPSGRGNKLTACPVKVLAEKHGIPVFQFEKVRRREGREAIEALRPDLCVTAAFGQILSQRILDIPPMGTVNVHASLLPKYRGSAPINWCIALGEKKAGVTTMFTDAGIDTGDMALRAETEIGELETAGELTARLAEMGAKLLIETIHAIENGTCPREKQDESEPSLHAVVRVPAEGLDDFLSQMEMVGRTVRRVEQARDLSADFRDVEERLNACRSKLQKLYELQDSCQDVNDLVTIAQTISDDIAESERLQSSQSELNSQINYATVEIDLAGHIDADEREPVTGDTSGESMGERMKSGFASSVEWLRSFSTDALVLLVSSLPRLVVFIPALALVILLIVWIARKKHR